MSAFPPNLCTHAIYGLAKLEENQIVSGQPLRDLPENLKGYQIFNDLKLRNPNLKTLIGIGGWDMGSAPFSFMASNPEKRSVFIDSVVSFIDKHGFDGIDIDWAYPGSNGGRPVDRQNLELKAALKPRGKLMTATVSATASVIEMAYDIPKISEELDQIHILSFDFYGSWNNYTGMNAPLYAPAEATMEEKEETVDFAVNMWLEGGVPKEKLVLSLPFFGRTYTLADPSKNGVGAAATGAGKPGQLNGNDEELGFNEICENLTKNRWASVWDTDSHTPYAYKENQWVSYDDQKSLNTKVEYLIRKGLAGALVRSIDTDDHKGQCYGKKYVLLRSVASKLLL
ncbi:hypothetical protein JTE90_010883 [Oedothorax gibbosus]|uniref:GH18 domain-containing protein n=1 Tax=Oedothorax gibbosus TaxID=931172 RepID=A0AAV6U224_9ARAC|nr:hypothetical protein JTE90_010883 [Oedothorax gibbosus]